MPPCLGDEAAVRIIRLGVWSEHPETWSGLESAQEWPSEGRRQKEAERKEETNTIGPEHDLLEMCIGGQPP